MDDNKHLIKEAERLWDKKDEVKKNIDILTSIIQNPSFMMEEDYQFWLREKEDVVKRIMDYETEISNLAKALVQENEEREEVCPYCTMNSTGIGKIVYSPSEGAIMALREDGVLMVSLQGYHTEHKVEKCFNCGKELE